MGAFLHLPGKCSIKSATREYDVIVIGAGSTGENVADRAVRGGLTAAIVESDLVGGECSYWACMPSKSLLRPGSALRGARSVRGAREAVTGKLDITAVFNRRDYTVANWDDSGQAKWLAESRIDLVKSSTTTATMIAAIVMKKLSPDGSYYWFITLDTFQNLFPACI